MTADVDRIAAIRQRAADVEAAYAAIGPAGGTWTRYFDAKMDSAADVPWLLDALEAAEARADEADSVARQLARDAAKGAIESADRRLNR